MKILIGKQVVTRANLSGVWYGRLASAERAKEGWDCVLEDAIKVHAWSGTAATSGLAFRGPGDGSRLCPEVDAVVVADSFELILATKDAIDRFAALPRWEA